MMDEQHLERHHFTPLSEERFKEILELIEQHRAGKISEKVFDHSMTDEDYRNAMMMAQLRDYKV